jgi:hypothetical protein
MKLCQKFVNLSSFLLRHETEKIVPSIPAFWDRTELVSREPLLPGTAASPQHRQSRRQQVLNFLQYVDKSVVFMPYLDATLLSSHRAGGCIREVIKQDRIFRCVVFQH